MEASALTHSSAAPALRGPSPLLRLQSDERLIALTRRGQHAAFEALCSRYQSRLLVLLPAHAQLARGRRGRPAGGLRRRLQRRARRRARDQRAAVAVPHRPQPLAQPPAPRIRRRRRLDGRPLRRPRHVHRRPRDPPRELPRAARQTCTTCPRRSAPRCCCARSTRSPTSRSPTRWRRPCRPSSRCSCARASRSPRPPRRAS